MGEEAWDDVSGAPLDPQEVRRARREEIDYVHKLNLYDKVPVEEAYDKQEKDQSQLGGSI